MARLPDLRSINVRSVLSALAALLLLAAPPAQAPAQCQDQWLTHPDQVHQGLGSTNMTSGGGYAYATVLWDPDGAGPEPVWFVVGGRFEIAGGVFTTNIAGWDGQAWHALGNGLTQDVKSLCNYNGSLYAGTSYTDHNNQPAGTVFRFTGTTWETSGYFNGGVLAMASFGGNLYAGGEFPTGNYLRRMVAGVWQNADGGCNGVVRTLMFFGSTQTVNSYLAIGGDFTVANGIAANHIVRIRNVDGGWEVMGTGTNNNVYAATSYSISSLNLGLVIAGSFTTASGVPALGLARWTGTMWDPMDNPSPPTTGYTSTRALGVHAGAVHASMSVNGVGAGLFKWTGSVWQYVNAETYAGRTATFGGQLIAVDSMSFSNSIGIRAWNGTAWTTLGGHGSINGSLGYTGLAIDAIAEYGGDVVMGGRFRTAGSAATSAIARWNEIDGWRPLGSGVDNLTDGLGVWCLRRYGAEVVAGGSFSGMGGVAANCIAAWNGTSWRTLGSGMSVIDPQNNFVAVYDIALYNNQLIACGHFDRAGGQGAVNIARWTGSAWVPLGSGLTGTAQYLRVNAMAVFNNELVVGGDFTQAGGITSPGIAAWNGTSWRAWAGGGISNIQSLAVYQGQLYAGGSIGAYAPGTSTNGIARWNGTGWDRLGEGLTWTSGGTTFSGQAYSMLVRNNKLYVGGRFAFVDGAPANGIAAWDGGAWQPVGSGVTAGSSVYALTDVAGTMFVGGQFPGAGGVASIGWSRVGCVFADCDGIDFNTDGLFPDVQDITDFINVFGGGSCAPPAPSICNTDIDFNNDGLFPDTADIESLLRVFSGGPCN